MKLHLQLPSLLWSWGGNEPETSISIVIVHWSTDCLISIINSGAVERAYLPSLAVTWIYLCLRKVSGILCQESGRKTILILTVSKYTQPQRCWQPLITLLGMTYFSAFTPSSQCSTLLLWQTRLQLCKTHFQHCFYAVWKALPSVLLWYQCALVALCAASYSLTHGLEDKDCL